MKNQNFENLSLKYPDLQFMLSSPENFLQLMNARFENQKLLTPETPYLFDYSELARPVVNKVVKTLEELTPPDSLFSYHQELLSQFLIFKNSVKIPYAPFYQNCYFFTRLMGLFFENELSFKESSLLKIDRILEGYSPLSHGQEYKMFKNENFKLLQKFSPVGGFCDAVKTFGHDYSDSGKMHLLFVPVFQELGTDILMALTNYPIFLLGITVHPEAADGFVRPSGDFWMHDVRHSSTMYHKRLTYEQNLNLTQKNELRTQINLWQEQLNQELSKLDNSDLKNAISFILFNTHHDRGVVMVPSAYLSPLINYLPFALLTILKVSKQTVGFKQPLKNLLKAYAWLRKFWLPHQELELQRFTPSVFSLF